MVIITIKQGGRQGYIAERSDNNVIVADHKNPTEIMRELGKYLDKGYEFIIKKEYENGTK